MSASESEEFKKLYAILSGLSSKINPKPDNDTTPMISIVDIGRSDSHIESPTIRTPTSNKEPREIKDTESQHSNSSKKKSIEKQNDTNSSILIESTLQDSEKTSKEQVSNENLVRKNNSDAYVTPAQETSRPSQAKPSPPSASSPSSVSQNHTQRLNQQLEQLRREMEMKCKEMIEDCLETFKKSHPSISQPVPIKLKKRPVAGDEQKEHSCIQCKESFANQSELSYHYFMNRMCNRWKNITNKQDYVLPPKPLHTWIHELADEVMMLKPHVIGCRFCHEIFTTKLSLRKHYEETDLCNRLAFYELKQRIISMNESVTKNEEVMNK